MLLDIYSSSSPVQITKPVIEIELGTTWFAVECDILGKLPCGLNIGRFVAANLVQKDYDPRLQIWKTQYNYTTYDKERNRALFPRYALNEFITYLGEGYEVQLKDVPPISAPDIKLSMKKGFQLREHQGELFDFLISDGSYKPLGAQTGSGKSSVSLAAICYHKKAAFIVLGFLIDQWYKNIRQFTTVRRDDIFVIKGFDSLKNLWEMLHNGFKPKIVICSTRTLMLYAVDRKSPYDNLPTYQELLEALGIGTLVHDEVHLNFYANTQIDLRSNVAHNIFLSATYMRSDFQGKRIFHLVFPKEMIFGGSEIKKYTKVMVMSYDLGIPDAAIVKFKVLKGYLHAKYESFLLRNKRYFDRFISEVLQRLIDQFYIPVRKPEQKLLILCQTKLFVMHTVDTLKKLYPDLSPVPYFSGDSTYGKARMLEHKIIVSTIKSSSTGLDIKNLKVCINTVSFSSEPQAAQCMGRLRQLPDEDTIYVDIYNREVPSQCYHIQNRKKAYRDRALSIEESSYN